MHCRWKVQTVKVCPSPTFTLFSPPLYLSLAHTCAVKQLKRFINYSYVVLTFARHRREKKGDAAQLNPVHIKVNKDQMLVWLLCTYLCACSSHPASPSPQFRKIQKTFHCSPWFWLLRRAVILVYLTSQRGYYWVQGLKTISSTASAG